MTLSEHRISDVATCNAIVDITSEVPSEYCLYAIKINALREEYGEYIYARPTEDCNEEAELLDVWLVNSKNKIHPGYCNSGVVMRKDNLVFPARYVVIPYDEF